MELPIPSELLSEIVARADPLEWKILAETFPNINWEQVLELAVIDRPLELFYRAVEEGDDFLVRILVNYYGIDPSSNNNRAIITASINGHTEIVKFLLADPRVDPNANWNYAINFAIAGGYTDIVRLLLPRVEDGKVNGLLLSAINEERPEVVKLLLQDSRVDPSINNNLALRIARRDSQWEIVKLLEERN